MFEFEKEFHTILKSFHEIGALEHLFQKGWKIYQSRYAEQLIK